MHNTFFIHMLSCDVHVVSTNLCYDCVCTVQIADLLEHYRLFKTRVDLTKPWKVDGPLAVRAALFVAVCSPTLRFCSSFLSA